MVDALVLDVCVGYRLLQLATIFINLITDF